MSERIHTIAFSFDGTVCTYEYPDIGETVPGAIETLKALNANGVKLILYSVRSAERLQEAADWLENQGVVLWDKNNNPGQKHWSTSRKVYAQLYIDNVRVANLWRFPDLSAGAQYWKADCILCSAADPSHALQFTSPPDGKVSPRSSRTTSWTMPLKRTVIWFDETDAGGHIVPAGRKVLETWFDPCFTIATHYPWLLPASAEEESLVHHARKTAAANDHELPRLAERWIRCRQRAWEARKRLLPARVRRTCAIPVI